LAQIGSKQAQPRCFREFEIGLARFLPLLRQSHLLGQTPKSFWIGADHQVHNFVGPLLIKTMLTVKGRRDPFSRLMLGREHEPLGGVDQNTMSKIGIHVEQGKSGEDVDCTFFAAKHRQAEVAHQRMAELVCQGEESVAHDELDQPLPPRGSRAAAEADRAASLSLRFHNPDVDGASCEGKQRWALAPSGAAVSGSFAIRRTRNRPRMQVVEPVFGS
jgi:hypothetical protein